jgi:hypothetical protein
MSAPDTIVITPATPPVLPLVSAAASPSVAAAAAPDSPCVAEDTVHGQIVLLQTRIEQLARLCGVPKIAPGQSDLERLHQTFKVVDILTKLHLEEPTQPQPLEALSAFSTPHQV